MLISLIFFLLLLFTFLLFSTLVLVFLPAFVSHGVSPIRLTFAVSRSDLLSVITPPTMLVLLLSSSSHLLV